MTHGLADAAVSTWCECFFEWRHAPSATDCQCSMRPAASAWDAHVACRTRLSARWQLCQCAEREDACAASSWLRQLHEVVFLSGTNQSLV